MTGGHGRRRTAVLATVAVLAIAGRFASPAAALPVTSSSIAGWAENSTTGPDGRLYVSNLTGGVVLQRDAGSGGALRPLIHLPTPGGLAATDNTLYVATGNSPVSAVTGGGGVTAVDLRTGATRVLVTGLGETNGLALLPDGRVVVTVTAGRGAGVDIIDSRTGRWRNLAADIPTPNGLSVGPDGAAYVGSTTTGIITRVDPTSGERRVFAQTFPTLDDFGFLPDGRIALVTNTGIVAVYSPATRTIAPLRGALPGATSAKPASRGIAVTTALGSVLTIPATTPGS